MSPWHVSCGEQPPSPHSTLCAIGHALGATLVHFLSLDKPRGSFASALPALISGLRHRVDEALPGVYTWLEDSSLHCTLRACM